MKAITMIITSNHRKILIRLSETRDPIIPTDNELKLFGELFINGYLNYTHAIHTHGYTIACKGIEEVTLYKQRQG